MIKRGFLRWKEVLVAIQELPERERYYQRICKKVSIAPSHVRNILPWLELHGLIRMKKSTKIKYIIITQKGETVIADIMKLKKDMKNG
jgi:predicted transcriptional regulator